MVARQARGYNVLEVSLSVDGLLVTCLSLVSSGRKLDFEAIASEFNGSF